MINNSLNTQQREVAGRTTISKFDYQFHWALLKALQYYSEDAEFILCVEYHDDVLFVVCDDPSLPLNHENESINLIQVKALKTAFTQAAITKIPKKHTNSIIGKMILGVVDKGFEDKIKSLGLVSAAGFSNLKHHDSNDYESVYLTDLPKETVRFFKEKIDKEFSDLDSIKKENLLKKISLINTSLKEENMRDHLIGNISQTLENRFKNEYYRPLDIYTTLIDELRKKCSITYSYADWYDFKNNKGLTNQDIDTVKDTHHRNNTIIKSSLLIPDMDYPNILKVKIKKEFQRHHNLLLDKTKNISEYKLYMSIQKILTSHMSLIGDNLSIDDINIIIDIIDEDISYLATSKEHLIAAIIYGIESSI